MGFLDDLTRQLGGRPQDHQDFLDRYQRAPQDVPEQEALERYQQVAPHLPPDVYQQSAEEVFARLSPQERLQVGRHMAQQARQQGHSFPDLNQDGIDDRLQDPAHLAQVTGRMHQQQPGLLGQLLGGSGALGGGGMASSPLPKMVLGGIAALAMSRMMGGGGGGGPLGGGAGRGGGLFGG